MWDDIENNKTNERFQNARCRRAALRKIERAGGSE